MTVLDRGPRDIIPKALTESESGPVVLGLCTYGVPSRVESEAAVGKRVVTEDWGFHGSGGYSRPLLRGWFP